MPKITVIQPNGTVELTAAKGKNLLELLAENGIILPADCGGNGVCNKCLVRLVEGCVDVPLQKGYFRSCGCYIDSDISIEARPVGYSGLPATDARAEANKDADYGFAVDVGTTTLAVYLVDKKSGSIIDTVSALNPQSVYGADVISRINAAACGKLGELHGLIAAEIVRLKSVLLNKHGITQYKTTVIAANTVMLHLYKGVNPESMGRYPFTPIFTDTQYLEDGTVLLPSAGAFLGGDIVAGVLACGMMDEIAPCLLLDIGTNGEIILKKDGKYFGTATAAGPAFEGANIEMGMGGVAGAISRIGFDKELVISVIGGGEARGICGSALIDIVAILLQQGVIDTKGRLTANGSLLSRRIDGNKFFITSGVYITQKDIREFQLAKSAIRSGVETLLYRTGTSVKDIKKVYLAGGFGYYLDTASAAVCKLLPAEFIEVTTAVGNSSGAGAVMCLSDGKLITVCEGVAQAVQTVDLSTDTFFADKFIHFLDFEREN